MPLPTIPYPLPEDALRIISVKQLPQSKQVPTMYNKDFFATGIIDDHLVIRTLRTDMAQMYQYILSLEEALVDLEARVSANGG